jgi:leucyl aminopeptidase
MACEIAASFIVGCVGQDLYRAERAHHPFQNVTVLGSVDGNQEELASAVERGIVLGEAINITRELVNRPAYEIYPASFSKRAETLASEHGLKCEVLDKKRLQKERMGAILAVAAGSEKGPRVVVLEHRGGGDDAPTLALVGKGVTFDSGGLSLKTAEGMKTMKCDMAGAATVLGAMTAIARLKLPVNVTGYMGLTENMPSGSSYKLGDVLTARNGVTIEVLNTDAEGRLVLADVLAYAVDKGADRLIDLATLTGACVVALGEDVTGAFANDQNWCDAVLSAAKTCGEDAWQMPMFDLFDDLIKGDVADIKNIGGRWGGAITAAKFLQRFVGDKPWVHLDIAGPSFASSNNPFREGGATGCMVQTLVETAAGFGSGD